MTDEEREYLRACTQIAPEVIEEEFIRLPADIAFWNEKYAQAFREFNSTKVMRELLYNQLQMQARMQLEACAKGGRVTVGEVEAEVIMAVEYQEIRAAEIVAETEKVRLGGVLEALRAKRDMLIALGSHLRMEMANDPLIRQQRNVDREVRQNRG